MTTTEIVLQLVAGWLIADLLSGVLHWLEDRVLSASLPVLGEYVVAPNRHHHVDPIDFTRGSLLSRNSTTWIAALAIAAVWLLALGFSFVWLGALAGGLVVTEVHVRAHRNGVGRLYRILQEIGFVQSIRHHGQHHRGAMDSRYCILTGWLNPILDELGVWARIESLLGTVGFEPNRGTR